VLSVYHEPFRDEVVPILTVNEADSLGDLFREIGYFGHPGLWHFILYIGHQIYPDFGILVIVNLIISIIAIFLFLLLAPFDRFFKILFLLGILPLYEFPIINRNYGLGMLMVFLVCATYVRRWERFLPFAFVVGFMANTHAHLFILAGAVVISLFAELFFSREARRLATQHKVLVISGLMVIGVLMSVAFFHSIPPSESAIFTPKSLTLEKVSEALIKAVLIPGRYFYQLFHIESMLFANMVIGAFYIFLVGRWHLFILFATALIGLCMFFELVYPSMGMRHWGSLFFLMIMVMWMNYATENKVEQRKGLLGKASEYFQARMPTFFMVILLTQIALGYSAIKKDILRPYSSAADFATFIDRSPELKNAVIMGEHEGSLETLGYYLDNPVYFYRGQRFGKYRYFSKNDLQDTSLDELLYFARQIKSRHNQPVLLLLWEKIGPEGPYHIKLPYNYTFAYSPEEFRRFIEATKLVASFGGAITDEGFNVYLLE
jgi:hypothetical protein